MVFWASIFGQKIFVIPFSWDIFTCFSGIINSWNFWCAKVLLVVCQKKLLVSSAPDQSLVLLLSTFCQKFPDFDQDNVRHFRALLKQKGQAREKIVNSRNLMFLEEVNHDIVFSPQKNFWVQGEALKSNFLKVFRPRHFLVFWGASKITRTAGKKNPE